MEGFGLDDYPLVQVEPKGCYHTNHQNALHCADLGSVGAVVATSFHCSGLAGLHNSGQEDIGDLGGVVGARKCLGVECPQKEVAAGIGTEAVERIEDRRMMVEGVEKRMKTVLLVERHREVEDLVKLHMVAVVGVVGCGQLRTVVVGSVMHRRAAEELKPRTKAVGHTRVLMIVLESMKTVLVVDYAVEDAVIEEYKCFGRWVDMMSVVQNQNSLLRHCPEKNTQSCFQRMTLVDDHQTCRRGFP